MIQYIILLLPIASLAFYVYIERSKESIVKSTIILVFMYACALMISKKQKEVNILGLLLQSFGLITGYIYAIILGFKNISGHRNRLTKVKKDEAFNFSARRKDLTIINPYRGVLVVGGAGSGKSRTFIYPIIKQCAQKGYTGVLYDFKSPELMELTERCYKFYNNNSISIEKIDFKNPKNSQRVNPVNYVESAIHSTNYAQAFIYNLMPEYIGKQDFWSRSMLSIFSGTIWYFKKNAPHIATLPHIFAFFFTANAKQIVEILSRDNEVKGYISSLTEAVSQGAENQVAGVLGTLKNAIGIYNTPDIFWLLSKDETNLNVNDPKNPTMLLVGNSSTLSDSYAPLCSLIITVCSKLMNEPNKSKSAIIIDESPTIYLPNFEQIPATARSNKVAVVVGAQDISQMNDKYGREKTEVLISNLGNQFYGRTTNQQTAERVVKMFGQREDVVTLKGSKRTLIGYINKSQNQSIQKRDRVLIQQMTTLNPGQFAGILAEGKNKEFLEQIDMQKMPDEIEEIKPLNNYSSNSAQSVFNQIYRDVNVFLQKGKTVEEKIKSKTSRRFRRITDMDF